MLKKSFFDTPMGKMIAIGDNQHLYLLEFLQRKGLDRELTSLEKQYKIENGKSKTILSIQKELDLYFAGQLTQFQTQVVLLGTTFQKKAWKALMQVSFGETRSYQEQAQTIGKPKAYRAVANANGRNQIAIVIPCHRIIQANGSLGGYGGGVEIKKQLLELEKGIK